MSAALIVRLRLILDRFVLLQFEAEFALFVLVWAGTLKYPGKSFVETIPKDVMYPAIDFPMTLLEELET